MCTTRMSSRCLLVVLAAASLAACGDRTPEATIDTAAGAVDSALNVAGTEYTPAELLGLINEGQNAYVEASTLAQTKATDAGVKSFAKQIVDANRSDTSGIGSTAKTLNLTPMLPTNDENVSEDRVDGMKNLRDKAMGKEWDEAYLEFQIKMHRKILDEVNDALGRNPTAEMRTLLENTRTTLQNRLTRAEELEKKFGAV